MTLPFCAVQRCLLTLGLVACIGFGKNTSQLPRLLHYRSRLVLILCEVKGIPIGCERNEPTCQSLVCAPTAGQLVQDQCSGLPFRKWLPGGLVVPGQKAPHQVVRYLRWPKDLVSGYPLHVYQSSNDFNREPASLGVMG